MVTGCCHQVTASTRHVLRRRPSGGWGRTPPGTLEEGTPSAIMAMWLGGSLRLPQAQRASCWTESLDWGKAEDYQRKVKRLDILMNAQIIITLSNTSNESVLLNVNILVVITTDEWKCHKCFTCQYFKGKALDHFVPVLSSPVGVPSWSHKPISLLTNG